MSFSRLLSTLMLLVFGQVCVLAMFSMWAGQPSQQLFDGGLEKLRDYYNLSRDCKHTEKEVCMNVVSIVQLYL